MFSPVFTLPAKTEALKDPPRVWTRWFHRATPNTPRLGVRSLQPGKGIFTLGDIIEGWNSQCFPVIAANGRGPRLTFLIIGRKKKPLSFIYYRRTERQWSSCAGQLESPKRRAGKLWHFSNRCICSHDAGWKALLLAGILWEGWKWHNF